MRIRNALAFLVEARMREMMRDAREYELKALLTDLFGERAAAATVERLNARMGTLRFWIHHDRRLAARGWPASRLTSRDRRGRASSPSGAPALVAPASGAPASAVPACCCSCRF